MSNIPDLLDALKASWNADGVSQAERELIRMGNAVVPELLARALQTRVLGWVDYGSDRDKKVNTGSNILWVLKEIGTTEAASAIARIMNRPEKDDWLPIRRKACKYLGAWAEKNGLEAARTVRVEEAFLEFVRRDSDDTSIAYAIETWTGLVKKGFASDKTEACMLETLDKYFNHDLAFNSTERLRYNALECLAQFKSAKAELAIVRYLEDNSEAVFAAAHVLGEMGTANSISALTQFAEGKEGSFGNAARISFVRITLRESQDATVIEACLTQLGELGVQAIGSPYDMGYLKVRTLMLRHDIIRELTEKLKLGTSERFSQAAAEALVKMNAVEALPRLLDLQRNSAYSKTHVEHALSGIGCSREHLQLARRAARMLPSRAERQARTAQVAAK